MKPGDDRDEWGGSTWAKRTPEEVKRESEIGDLVKKVIAQDVSFVYRCIQHKYYY